MHSLYSGLYKQIVCVIFAIFLVHPNGLIKAQQLICPANYVLVDGRCVPSFGGQLTNGCVTVCNTTCPNQPIAPCPNPPIAPYPNPPVAPYPNPPTAPCPNPPIAPYPNPPVAPYPNPPTAPCPNPPIAPYPNPPVAPYPNPPITACPNPPIAPYPNQPIYPYPNQPTAPCPNQPIAPYPNQPIAPSPIPPIAPCPNQPIAPYPNQPIAPIPPTAPCPNQPITPCPIPPANTFPHCPPPVSCPTPPLCPSIPTTPPTLPTYPPTSPPTYRPPTVPPRPPAPIRCPEGTIPLNNNCRLVYCNKGVYRNNKCIQTVCPEGTTWTGYRCAPVEPIVHSIAFNNQIVTHFNRTEPDVVIKNVNNLVVNASVVVPLVPAPPVLSTLKPTSTPTTCEDNDDAEDCQHSNCCIVITPRMCERSGSRASKWNCYSRRYRRCGDFCIAPIVYLKAPKARETSSFMIMPPDEHLAHCRQTGSCPESDDFYDCSGCAVGNPKTCSSYCYNNQCSTRKCNFYDQKDYCNHYPGGNGCQEQDGCLDDWCDGGDDYDDYNTY